MDFLTVNNISKSFGSLKALDNVSFSINSNESFAILGSSGSGKSTLLRIIAGLEIPDEGSIILNNKTFVSKDEFVKPENRNIGFVFQDHSLFPHMTVRKNLEFALKNNTALKKIDKYLDIINLKSKIDNFPHELSGGEKQRISIIRTLLNEPELVLMDEPFSNLDTRTKSSLKDDLKTIFELENIPVIMITHDAEDSFDLSDRMILLERGSIIAEGNPVDVYLTPGNYQTAKYFSSCNILEKSDSNLDFFNELNIDSKLIFIRPAGIEIVEEGIKAEVVRCGFKGDNYIITVECMGAQLDVHSLKSFDKGTSINIEINDSDIILPHQ